MSGWVITSWVFVAILTGVNIFVFMKLKTASEQMLKMAFPSAKNMKEAMDQMQRMMGGRMPGGFGGFGGAGKGSKTSDEQLKAAMQMLKGKR